MRIIFVVFVSILFSQPVFAWEQVPLEDCYYALEKGVIIKNFSTGESNDYAYPKKSHVHVFIDQSIYDFYYKNGLKYTNSYRTRRAYCEVIRFTDYDCSGILKTC